MGYCLADGATFTEVDGSYALISDIGDVAVLNDVAGDMLKKFLASNVAQDVANYICEKYDTAEDVVLADLDTLLAALRSYGMIAPIG